MAKYHTSLLLIRLIDERIERGLHFRDTSGLLLRTLDQVVLALLDDRLTWAGKQRNDETNNTLL